MDYLIDGYSAEPLLDNLYAAFISEIDEESDTRAQIDVLSSGLVIYNGLRYSDTASCSWTDKLTIYLDTEFLFSCAGYNGEYYHKLFLLP